MVSQAPAIRRAELECTTGAVQKSAFTRMRAALAPAIAAALALTLSTTASAATITVNSLADTGATGICVLRDAITSANTMTATNGCAAGTGNDTIQFSLTGTISLASTLPQVTASILTIKGPASPGITLDGGGQVQVMTVASGATLNLNDLTIADAGAQVSVVGGGIDNSGTLTVTNSTFFGNKIGNCTSGSVCGGAGGAIYNGGRSTIRNSTFSGNSAGAGLDNIGYGGAIENEGSMTVNRSTFSGNSVDGGGSGGAISNGAISTRGTLTVTDSTFSGNGAGHDGQGGAIFNFDRLTVADSTFDSNGARISGGGIDNFSGSLTVINSTFSRNNAVSDIGDGGGAINTYGGTMTVTNSTFSGNTGGGIATSSGSTRVKNTILAANGDSDCLGPVTDAGYNIADDSTCGFSATGSHNSTDPKLDQAGLRNNGGPTQTIALQSTSSAIDAIPLADCTDQALPPNPIITDQRLFPRPDAEEANCDIGAYEFQDTAFARFSRFGGGLKIDPDAGVFYLSGGFKLGPGGSIDPTTQPVAFSVGSYAVRLPAGSFVKHNIGYVYQKTINGIFLCVFIKFTSTPGSYVLLANRIGGTLTSTTSPVPVTLTIGANSGSTQMNSRFN